MSVSPEPENKPKGEVVSSDGNEVLFRVKTTTKFGKLKQAYSARVGKPENSIRFLVDGVNVVDSQSPGEVDMEDGDRIDVVLSQIGGDL